LTSFSFKCAVFAAQFFRWLLPVNRIEQRKISRQALLQLDAASSTFPRVKFLSRVFQILVGNRKNPAFGATTTAAMLVARLKNAIGALF